jgi:hypothetical protein
MRSVFPTSGWTPRRPCAVGRNGILADDVRVMYQRRPGIAAAATANAAHRRVGARARSDVGGRRARDVRARGWWWLRADRGRRGVSRGTFDRRRRRLDERAPGAALATDQPDGHAGAGALLRFARPGRVRSRTVPDLDMDGRPFVLRLPRIRRGGSEDRRDVGGREVTGDTRSFDPDPAYSRRRRIHAGAPARRFGPYLLQRSCPTP